MLQKLDLADVNKPDKEREEYDQEPLKGALDEYQAQAEIPDHFYDPATKISWYEKEEPVKEIDENGR